MDAVLDFFKKPEEYEAEGLSLVDQGDFLAAVRSFSKAIGAYGAKTPVQPIYNRGLCYVHLQQMQAGLDDFNRCLEINKDYEPALLCRSRVFLYFGQYAPCQRDCRHLLRLNANNTKAMVNIGAAFHERGMLKEAYDMYVQALTLDPDDVLAMRNLNRVCIDEPSLELPEHSVVPVGSWPI